jgi:hypothetical protein
MDTHAPIKNAKLRQIGQDRPWLRFGYAALPIYDYALAQCALMERDPALQELQYDGNGPWWPLVDEPGEQAILARMRAHVNAGTPYARMDAVDELIEFGLTTPEAWKRVWDAAPPASEAAE